MVRPSTFHAPGLDAKTDATIKSILRRWAKGEAAPASDEGKTKKRKR